MAQIKCADCGADINGTGKFCEECGALVKPEFKEAPKKEDSVQGEQTSAAPPVHTAQRDPAETPMSTLGFLGMLILNCIPIIGLIVLIIFACDNSNLSRRNFARAMLIFTLISVVLSVIVFVVAITTLYTGLIDLFSSFFENEFGEYGSFSGFDISSYIFSGGASPVLL